MKKEGSFVPTFFKTRILIKSEICIPETQTLRSPSTDSVHPTFSSQPHLRILTLTQPKSNPPTMKPNPIII